MVRPAFLSDLQLEISVTRFPDDSVEPGMGVSASIVLQLKLAPQEKQDLVAFVRQL